MNHIQREVLIKKYFDMWVERNFSSLEHIFAPDIYYSECYGPEYYGLNEIYVWIDVMLKKQTVLEWSIKRFIHENNTIVVEWFFKESQNQLEHAFDGVSIIEFCHDNKILSIKEFKSKHEHTAPYHKNG